MNYRTPLPSIEQLAMLAANINTETTADGKVRMAIDVWEAAEQAIKNYQNVRNQIRQLGNRESENLKRIPNDLIFTNGKISLKDFLRSIFPKVETITGREEILHDFLSVPNPAIPDGIRAFDRIKKDGIQEAFANGFAVSILKWYERNKQCNLAVKHKTKSQLATDHQHQSRRLLWAFNGEEKQMRDTLIINLAAKILPKSKDLSAKRNKAQDVVDQWIADAVITKDGRGFVCSQK